MLSFVKILFCVLIIAGSLFASKEEEDRMLEKAKREFEKAVREMQVQEFKRAIQTGDVVSLNLLFLQWPDRFRQLVLASDSAGHTLIHRLVFDGQVGEWGRVVNFLYHHDKALYFKVLSAKDTEGMPFVHRLVFDGQVDVLLRVIIFLVKNDKALFIKVLGIQDQGGMPLVHRLAFNEHLGMLSKLMSFLFKNDKALFIEMLGIQDREGMPLVHRLDHVAGHRLINLLIILVKNDKNLFFQALRIQDREGIPLLHRLILNENWNAIRAIWMEIVKHMEWQDRDALLIHFINIEDSHGTLVMHLLAASRQKLLTPSWEQFKQPEYQDLLTKADVNGNTVLHIITKMKSKKRDKEYNEGIAYWKQWARGIITYLKYGFPEVYLRIIDMPDANGNTIIHLQLQQELVSYIQSLRHFYELDRGYQDEAINILYRVNNAGESIIELAKTLLKNKKKLSAQEQKLLDWLNSEAVVSAEPCDDEEDVISSENDNDDDDDAPQGGRGRLGSAVPSIELHMRANGTVVQQNRAGNTHASGGAGSRTSVFLSM